MKTKILGLLLLVSGHVFSQQVLTRVNTAASTNKSFQIYRQNSPTNIYGNSHVLFETNHDSTYLRSNFVRVDILDNRLGYSADRKFISANNSGLLFQGSFDSLTFPTSQITYLDSFLLERPTLADGAILYKPISYSPTYTDVITGLGYSPLSQLDTISLSNRIDIKISSEVDGSITNEIELPSQSGQSGKILSTNGSSPSWISLKRQETYSGTTTGTGTYTVTFSTAYTVAPNIQATCTNCTDTQRIRVTSISTTGFTIQGRNEAIGLIFTNANALNVDVLITEL